MEPQFTAAESNLGNTHADRGEFEQAVACYRRALDIDPDFADARKNLAHALAEQGEYGPAEEALHAAITLRPLDGTLKNPCGPLAAGDCRIVRVDRRAAGEALARPRRASEARNSTSAIRLSRRWGPRSTWPITAATTWICSERLPPSIPAGAVSLLHRRALPQTPTDSRPWALGGSREDTSRPFAWAFSRGFSTTIPWGTIMRASCGPFLDAGPATRCFVFRGQRRVSRQIEEAADDAVLLSPRLAEAREQIAARELDVLFYTDIGMDPWAYFLAFALAAVQCVALGHPVTTGIPTIDYFLWCDRLEPAGAEGHYSERLVRFANMPHHFSKPRELGHEGRRSDYPIPSEARWYVCHQTLFKIHPEFDGLIGEILRRDPREWRSCSKGSRHIGHACSKSGCRRPSPTWLHA